MLFLALSNTNVSFVQKKFTWSFYTTSEALLITWRIKIIDRKEFAAAVLDLNKKTFVV